MKRTLVLDENDLIMVVKEDVVRQIDENRGEMTRTEFVNYLIQCQLREFAGAKQYVTKEDLYNFTRQVTDVLRGFLEFFISYGILLNHKQSREDIRSLSEQLEALNRNPNSTSSASDCEG
ncbi:MAG: hypothetical protein N2506_02430 [Dehalococcoidales bacterium]|nr:hypothetical protein [Dehalococcoidales bacterium]